MESIDSTNFMSITDTEQDIAYKRMMKQSMRPPQIIQQPKYQLIKDFDKVEEYKDFPKMSQPDHNYSKVSLKAETSPSKVQLRAQKKAFSFGAN